VGEQVDSGMPKLKGGASVGQMMKGVWTAFPDIHSVSVLALVNGRQVVSIDPWAGSSRVR
jgi:hypothetical protein